MASPGAPAAFSRPQGSDVGFLTVALVAVSTSGPLMAGAAVPALAIAFWRNAMATCVLAPYSALRGRVRNEIAGFTRSQWRMTTLSGLVLALHFGTWVPSLTYTSVASATALCATQPVWAALIARWQGHHIQRSMWVGMIIALVGVVTLTGIDVSLSSRALGGDLLAIAGGLFGALYTALGGQVRQTVSTSAYTTVCYSTCALLLLPVCLLSGSALSGYTGRSWIALLLVTLGAQFLGHSLINRVLRGTDATFVSLMILLEVPGAALLAALFLDQTPSWRAVPAAALLIAGIVITVRASGRATPVVD